MPEPLRSDPPVADTAQDIQHLRDVLSALEFLRNDAAKTVPPLFKAMILTSLDFLCEAYRHILREATASHGPKAEESYRRVRRTAVQ